MVEKLLDDDEELLIDTPFLRRLRQNYEKGREEGALHTLRHDILDILQVRFSLPADQMEALTRALDKVGEEPPLRALFRAALQAEHLAAFQTALEEQRQQQEIPPTE